MFCCTKMEHYIIFKNILFFLQCHFFNYWKITGVVSLSRPSAYGHLGHKMAIGGGSGQQGDKITPEKKQTIIYSSPLSLVKSKNALGNLIKKGNVDKFIETVWGNPWYLLSPGDTPEIIHFGMRRNALHLVVQHRNLHICWNLMWIIRSERSVSFKWCFQISVRASFWQYIHDYKMEVSRQNCTGQVLHLTIMACRETQDPLDGIHAREKSKVCLVG